MIVTHVTGDCPKCGAAQSFGNVLVLGDVLLRGCAACETTERVELPRLRKAVVYLDQFVFSGAQRDPDGPFADILARIRRSSSLQRLVAPFSSLHELEAYQWREGRELMNFIRAVSRGHRFRSDHDVLVAQVLAGLARFTADGPAQAPLKEADAIPSEAHHWDGYFRIDLTRYLGDTENIRLLKSESVARLIHFFDEWQASRASFEEDVELEVAGMADALLGAYFQYLKRTVGGDLMAEVDSPVTSRIAPPARSRTAGRRASGDGAKLPGFAALRALAARADCRPRFCCAQGVGASGGVSESRQGA